MSSIWQPCPVVGDTYTRCLVDELTRAHIVQYAGASGDFNLVHTDEPFAVTAACRPSVIAHGMLTMGLSATFITELVGHGALTRFGGRFLAPVLPGQRLTSAVTVTDVTRHGTQLALDVVTHADGREVFAGCAAATRATR